MNYGLLPTLKDELVKIASRGRINTIAPGLVATRMIRNKMANKHPGDEAGAADGLAP